jgi:hypothetical protein
MAKYKRITILVVLLVGGMAVLTLLVHLQTAAAAPFLTTTTTLYDGSLGGTPDTQEMIYLTQPSPPFPPSQATQTFSNNVTILDTTATNDDYAGYFGNKSVPALDRTQGYTLHFTVQIDSESHANSHRAGFSVIVLSDDVKGIELAFWQDEVWAQHDDSTGNLFTHGEGAAFDTTTGLIAYELAIISDTYSLLANDIAILAGPLRDYTNFPGFPDPYETPNLIFLGDDTTSAQALIQLAFVAVTVTEPPVEPTSFLFLPSVVN